MNMVNFSKVVLLLLMVPLLIGHGMGGYTSAERVYTSQLSVVGGAGSGTVMLEIDGTQEVIDFTADGYVSQTINNLVINEGDTFRVSMNSDTGDAAFTRLMLTDGLNRDLSLAQFVVAETPGTFFDVTYKMRSSDMGSPFATLGASMSKYLLAGGMSGSESIDTPGLLSVYVNSILIYEGVAAGLNNPISFDAISGDKVTVVVSNVVSSGEMGEIWLHDTRGVGSSLSYKVELLAGSEFRTTYRIY